MGALAKDQGGGIAIAEKKKEPHKKSIASKKVPIKKTDTENFPIKKRTAANAAMIPKI